MRTRHKGADHHLAAAQHLELAAQHHRQAVACYKADDFALAAHQSQIAYGHLQHALKHAGSAAMYHAEHYGDEAVKYGTEHFRATPKTGAVRRR